MGSRLDVSCDDFDRDGYAVIDGIVDVEEVVWLVDVIDALVARAAREADPHFQDLTAPFGSTSDGRPAVPQLIAPHRLAPDLLDGRFLAAAAEIGRRCLGADSQTNIAMAVAKPGHSPGVVPWHQDAAYWDNRVRGAGGASIWLPLQNVDESNGCLSFVPRSHRSGVLPHRSMGGDPAVHALELDPAIVPESTRGAVAVPLKLGQASIHDGHLLHHSGPNRTDRTRHALVMSIRRPVDRPSVRPGGGAAEPSDSDPGEVRS